MGTSYDQGMDVYVVSNCWWREGQTVIGASTDEAGAIEIADRAEHLKDEVPPAAGWKDWERGAEGTLRRDALNPDGTTHASLEQEIVCVPLAGSVFPETHDPLAGLRRIRPIDDRPMAHRMTESGPDLHALSNSLGYPAALDALISNFLKAQAASRQALEFAASGTARVGSGAAQEYMQHVVDMIPIPDRGPSWKIDGSFVAGIRVVIDETVPPDEIRIGSVTYVIGTEANGIGAGQMVRVDESELKAWGPPATTPRG
jgi:hypothetical protein